MRHPHLKSLTFHCKSSRLSSRNTTHPPAEKLRTLDLDVRDVAGVPFEHLVRLQAVRIASNGLTMFDDYFTSSGLPLGSMSGLKSLALDVERDVLRETANFSRRYSARNLKTLEIHSGNGSSFNDARTLEDVLSIIKAAPGLVRLSIPCPASTDSPSSVGIILQGVISSCKDLVEIKLTYDSSYQRCRRLGRRP